MSIDSDSDGEKFVISVSISEYVLIQQFLNFHSKFSSSIICNLYFVQYTIYNICL